MSVYRDHHHSCFLYLGSIIADEFGEDSNFQTGLVSMTEAFAEVSFPLLSGPTGLIDHPDTIDDMFRLCARYVCMYIRMYICTYIVCMYVICIYVCMLYVYA